MIESLMLAVSRVCTFQQQALLTKATGFFFESAGQLFLVTSRHVMFEPAAQHVPDRLEIEFHDDPDNLASSITYSIPLYQAGQALWREMSDQGGLVDVAMIQIDKSLLPAQVLYRAFSPEHLQHHGLQVEAGSALVIPGFPLGFHDDLHHIPVVRHAIIASSFGFRFQGQGYFLTDARTHRGSSGAPVLMRWSNPPSVIAELPWCLLGVHSARLDTERDSLIDEGLGLNCAWYADVLLRLQTGQ